MTRKHNTKHRRSVSNYAARLAARGLSSAQVRMPFIDRRGHKHQSAEAFLKRSDDKVE
jgi:predicted GTPase